MMILKTFSSNETKKIAKNLTQKIINKYENIKNENALIFALIGQLGTGKTTFVSGFLKGLNIKKPSPSPTFILMRRKKINHKFFKNLYHIDAYRIKNNKELLNLNLKEILNNPQNIVLIEWANKIENILPANTIQIHFYHGKFENERKIILKNITL
ncbi:MAG: tRNA (adenosine(37)-N6)-threonylcarbamoyltransferase complex ATPase subunit type 1 TsaE [Patescibacteria group bacterium]|nr:tRNA (adenosine(37)-N6)-threonylcarbamoyltransferase complex ATPase subunit type 1 TsaE [Patescibacteria group bacterium]MCX7589458.1 tRNA (adenosine(37)-N6)-threonylcarbamoyltransferase complex ATPase subunit type 1 TsaE [Patescibacteria group bacterium]MDW8279630.1 tRNA (adenosine(37)-N6)-threonylcarbamoyltransferase complex ATPase subunit type 1 TsaE [bacterium]